MQEFPIKQFVKEFKADTNARPRLEDQINDFMDEWREENVGNLRIADFGTIERIYPGDQTRGSFLIVVFEWWPLSKEQAENIELMNLAKERSHGGGG
jgi:hypothetical protein